MVSFDMNFTAHKGKYSKKMASYISCWIGKKDRVDFEGLNIDRKCKDER